VTSFVTTSKQFNLTMITLQRTEAWTSTPCGRNTCENFKYGKLAPKLLNGHHIIICDAYYWLCLLAYSADMVE